MSGLTSREGAQADEAFAGDKDLLRAWADGVTPDANLTVSQWAGKYRVLWTVAVSTFKSETYRFLRLERQTPEELSGGALFPPGTLHLPDWIDSEWLKQLFAEQLVTVRNKRGFARLEWQKLRERNEALDCRVYARAAAWILGADRWSDKQWDELERQMAAPDAAVGTGTVKAARQSRPANQRRSVRSNYMR